MSRKTGTKEWASSSVNIQTGCSHGCLYCYAAAQAVRFKRRAPGDWLREEREDFLSTRRLGKRRGRIMFPTAHDITEANLEACYGVLLKMLDAGNDVLIVSKPSRVVISLLTAALPIERFGAQVTFRFTIGSKSDEILSYWEPHAPRCSDRMDALRLAHRRGWATSVSIEPMLDSTVDRVADLVESVAPSVTDSIWIGMMNSAEARVKMNGHADREGMPMALAALIRSPEQIRELHARLAGHPLVRWKDSIKQMLGLPEEDVG